ncbi:acyl-CoA dehydrogenase [Streptomyces klenkii]|uniref:Acyl-CoA dehydrogenase n=1 Tax=Streptomyces klenkii TaxID=1420899 RepID=A0A3B0BG83_9ACTN|nr:acyl-CoA dehydrogenase family protein [Streptomyces klenkii]RKN70936.1 acyl-CoA dehydrogenase [Streptomyces klenkii]
MDFRLTDDQRALRAGMRGLLAARYPRERLRSLADADADVDAGAPGGPPTPDRGLWQALGEAGFFALRLTEQDGGAGLGLPEAVLLFEEAGRALLPGPLVATHLAAGLVPGAAEGACAVTALDRPGAAEHLASAEAVLLLDGPAARALRLRPGGAPRALRARPARSVDPTTPLHLVRQLPRPSKGSITTLPADASRLRREAALLTAAQQLGSAFRTIGLAVSHARRRSQFGRPVGAFQAVQHLCAEMLVRAELARTAVYAASLSAEADGPAEIATAKLLADSAAIRNARDCLQVHGGLGFTWEADVHLHLKRAWLRAGQWQSAAESEELLANTLLHEASHLPEGHHASDATDVLDAENVTA